MDEYNETGKHMPIIYPDGDGFKDVPHNHTLTSDEIISRYEDKGAPAGNGRFASPAGTDYDARSLPHVEDKKDEHFYRMEDGETLDVKAGEVREFRGDEGTGATQYYFDKPIKEYVAEGKMYECNAQGHRINENGQLINKEGHLVDEHDRPINEKGQLVDENDQPLDKDE